MKEDKIPSDEFTNFHQRVEDAGLDQPIDLQELSPEEVQHLVHELRAHQIELEMKNEELRLTQQELKASRDRYSDLYDFAPVGYLTISEKGVILESNLTGAAMLGMDRDDLIRHSFSHFVAGEDQNVYHAHHRKLFETQAPQVCEIRLVKKDNSQFYARVEATVEQDSAGSTVCRAVLSDIAEQVRAKEALRESEQRFRQLADVSFEAIVIHEEGILLEANEQYFDMFGYKKEELLGKQAIPLTVAPESRDFLKNQIASGSLDVYEVMGMRKDGTKFPIEVRVRAIEYQGRQVRVGIIRDVTERKRTEEALQGSEERYRTISELATDFAYAFCVKPDGTLIYEWATEALPRTTGFTVDELKSRGGLLTIIHPDDTQAVLRYIQALRSNQKPGTGEFRIITKNGDVRWIYNYARPVWNEAQGSVMRIYGAAQDITERKRAEAMLQQRNHELTLLNRASQAFNATLDLDQVLITVLEGVRHLMKIDAGSVWLIDPETDELVCRQASGLGSEVVMGWRLAPGEGIAGWVARHGESLIISDMQTDERHFKKVDQKIGLEFRSILSIPLQVKRETVGVLHVLDTTVDRFNPIELTLIESLAATATIAIENALLYEQAKQDAETKELLLREVNHRVGNNLAAIVGILSIERNHIVKADQNAYQSIMNDLTNRVTSLSTVHQMLSVSKWTPLLLSELIPQIINASLQMLPFDRHISVKVTPSPVRVTSNQAHNLGLVINELATNAVKYALSERDIAHIAVKIALDGDTVQLEFQDDGPGYPETVLRMEQQSVGFKLIKNIVHRNLRGELSLRNDSGAVTIIRFDCIQDELGM